MIESEFTIFDISLVLGTDDILWLTADCPQGSIKAIPVKRPDFGSLYTGAEPPLEWLGTSVSQALRDRSVGIAIGKVLGATIFGTSVVRQLFDQTRGVARTKGQQVLLRILGAPSEIGDLPWELTTDPSEAKEGDSPIALAPDVHLVRTPRVRTYPIQSANITPPLNLLLILSSPETRPGEDSLDVFDLYEAKRHLMTELAPLVASGRLHVEVEDRPSIHSLRRRVGRQPRGFHVVHYLGHANPEGLALEDANGFVQRAKSSDFSALMQNNRDLRLVIFAGCNTAKAPADSRVGRWEGEMSITQHVVRDAAPAVIGMQAVLPFQTEKVFTRSFYQALTAGHTLANALKLARNTLWDGPDGRSQQLDWAIPTLFSAGTDPGQILDPDLPAVPPDVNRRVSLRVTPTQSEMRFVSRHKQLRTAVDTLSGKTNKRLLCVQGRGGIRSQDLSSFLDRAMAELSPDIAQLSFSAHDLTRSSESSDAVLTRYVKEIMRQSGLSPEEYVTDQTSLDWHVLLEFLSEVPLAIAIDHADSFPENDRIFERIQSIVRRRSKVRVAVVHESSHNPFNRGLEPSFFQPVVFSPIEWNDVWNWLRGQLPELVQFEKMQLKQVFLILGDRLDLWETLANHVAHERKKSPYMEIEKIAASLRQTPTSETPAPPPLFSEPELSAPPMSFNKGLVHESPAPANENHPIRIAVAGPHSAGRDAEFLDAMRQYANHHGLIGRVSGEGDADNSVIVAKSLPSGSPFSSNGVAQIDEIANWITRIVDSGVDILVCDFGGPEDIDILRGVLTSAANRNRLIIAAAGNSEALSWPANYKFVLGVGGLDKKGRPYGVMKSGSTDLFASDTLLDTLLEGWVEEPHQIGTSYAAMNVAAAASLVWSTYPALSSSEVRDILYNSAYLIRPDDSRGPRALNVKAAIDEAYRLIILDALESDNLTFDGIVVETGLSTEIVRSTMRRLEHEDAIELNLSEDGVEICYLGSLARQYDEIRSIVSFVHSSDTHPSIRTDLIQADLMLRAQRYMARRNITQADMQELWASNGPYQRFLVLANMYERTEMRDIGLLVDGITDPKSGFEQYHALAIVEQLVDEDMAIDEAAVIDVVRTAVSSGHFGLESDRGGLANSILQKLGASGE